MKYLYVFIILSVCIVVGIQAQTLNNNQSDNRATVRKTGDLPYGTTSPNVVLSTYPLYRSYYEFNDCTFNSDNVLFVMKMTAHLDNGNVECGIFIAENGNIFENEKRWGPLTIPRNSSVILFTEFSLLPLDYDLSTLDCDSPVPSYCLGQPDFDCCDCAQWEPTYLEGMWYDDDFVEINSQTDPTVVRVIVANDVSSLFYTPVPNPQIGGLGGCTCCTS